MGRPSKPATDLRRKRVPVYFTNDEYWTLIVPAARALGMPPALYLNTVVRGLHPTPETVLAEVDYDGA